jgi:aspartokinase
MMASSILVQKFGGTSVSTPECRQLVVEHVRSARAAGLQVAVVVSAMGRRGDPYATDSLLDLLRADSAPIDPRDYDLMFTCGEAISAAMLSHTLRRAGIAAVGLTSAQVRIFTDGCHQEAEITRIETTGLRSLMAHGVVPVVTGAQGIATRTFDFTTLGRGGSDTSGVALGVALHADKVEIFTDVLGVASADPRLVPRARLLRQVSFRAMHEMARFGATVIHPRAVNTGSRSHIPIVVRSTFSDDPGTLIGDVVDKAPIVGLAVLPKYETVALPAHSVDRATCERWERDGFMSLCDRRTGAVIVGTVAERVAELRAVLGARSVQILSELHDSCWISVVGDVSALKTVGERDLSSLLGSDVYFEEFGACRATYVIRDHARASAAEALYSAVIEST